MSTILSAVPAGRQEYIPEHGQADLHCRSTPAKRKPTDEEITPLTMNEITSITRRALIDELTGAKVGWAGRLDEVEFLSRIYQLSVLPSTDTRFSDASGDIQTHRITWQDWDADWVFFDDRFNLFEGPDEPFLRFLCETLHPDVRPDPQVSRHLASIYNSHLRHDGWCLVEIRQISGRPVFAAQREGQVLRVFDEPTGWTKVDRQLRETRDRTRAAETEEQFQGIGLLCREALISVAQEVYDERTHASPDGVTPSDTDAKRMLEAFIAHELPGSTNEEARMHAKSALRLALALQHKRTADFRTAALCAEATFSLVNIIAILSGRPSRLL